MNPLAAPACRLGFFAISALAFSLNMFPSPLRSDEKVLGFLETFALASDRAAALEELIPGTEDHDFYRALLAQQEGRFDEVDGILESWRDRHGATPRLREIENRQALLRYSEDPGSTLAFLRDRLGLRFDHEQRRPDARPDLPVALAPGQVSWETFREAAMREGHLQQVADRGLDRLLRDEVALTETQRRELLARLRLPDYDRLVGLIAADLRTQASRGFGEFEIHRHLTATQLDELLGLRPELINDAAFVHARLAKIAPHEDLSLARDPAAKEAHLRELWAFVETLPPSFNSLKAQILYRRLEAARAGGDYPRELFDAYLRLPRSFPYVEPRLLATPEARQHPADLTADFSAHIGLPPVPGDEPLVRDYLEHFFVEDEGYQRYAPFVREDYLRRIFAETKLLHGVGEAEQWHSQLRPDELQALRDRVEIAFSPANPVHFDAGDEVALDLRLKNTGPLTVKLYELNALNYYLDQQREIDTDLPLDGLVANEETVHRYDDPPVRRRGETFVFESLAGRRGIWVAEFIGNGISSRALIRKGRLQHLSETTPGGELFTLLDENNEPVAEPEIWFGGRRYGADGGGEGEGRVLLPFSVAGSAAVVLGDGEIASFARVPLPRENYRLEAGFLLEQETLLPGAEAIVAVRPVLTLQGEPVGTRLLRDVRLAVATTDFDGVPSLNEASDFALFDDRESLHAFRVPNRLRSLEVRLTARVESIVEPGEFIELSASRRFTLLDGLEERDGVSQDVGVADLHLRRLPGGYEIELRGRGGEALADRALRVELAHRDFLRPLSYSLKTDASGRVALGTLEGVATLKAESGGVLGREWALESDRHAASGPVHAVAGEAVVLPMPGAPEGLSRSRLAVFETRRGETVRDLFGQAELSGGALRLVGLDPGDYRVHFRESGETRTVRVTAATGEAAGYALSEHRHLQLRERAPLLLGGLRREGDELLVAVGNADPFTRVHLVATRYLPAFDPYAGLGGGHRAEPFRIARGANETRYVSGRDIGEEYRYILERRGAEKFPGNLLSRPGLILNPWALDETATAIDEAAAGEEFRRSGAMEEARREGGAMAPVIDGGEDHLGGPGLRFLASQAVLLPNLEVGEDGLVRVPVESLGDRHHVQIVAVNARNTASRQFLLPPPEDEAASFRDLRLSEVLEQEKDFAQRRRVTLLHAGETLALDDLRSSEFEVYDTVAGLYGTLLAIHPDETLAEFSFIARWPQLEEAEKRELYSKHASHELHFFLSRRDPEFFERVVKSYLANKMDRTFLDRYLLEEPLERYLEPWAFARLNVVERILLGRRLGGAAASRAAQHVGELVELLPPDPALQAQHFRSALRGKGASLDGFGGGGAGDYFAAPAAEAIAGFGFDGEARSRSAAPMMKATPIAPRGGGLRARVAMAPPGAPESAETPEMVMEDRPEPAADAFAAPAPAMMAAPVDYDAVRDQARAEALYRRLEATREWAENHYHHLRIEEQLAELVGPNLFWRDFARWDGEGGFYSREFPAATGNFTEMMFVLSLLDLPFEAEEHEIEVEGDRLLLTARSPAVVFHEEILEAPRAEEESPVLLSQNYYREGDRYRLVEGQRVERFVTDEFLAGEIYGSQVVVTNPTSATQLLELLVQIPEGAVPVGASDTTRSHAVMLAPFSTERIETRFYFPANSGDGSFAVYPARVAQGEAVLAAGEGLEFKVVDVLSRLDEASWDYLSQMGSEAEVLAHLEQANLQTLDLSLAAWRARESADFLRRATALVASRHGYDPVLWSYGLHHGETAIAREFLRHREDFLSESGPWFEGELASIDPVARHWHQHLEYSPLVNARSHRLGRENKILNDRFRGQYESLLEILARKPDLDDRDRLVVSGYLFLQDRVSEALVWLDAVEDPEGVETRLQHDYLQAYAAFYRSDLETASRLAQAHLEHPVARWRERFAAVDAQLREIRGEAPVVEEEAEAEAVEEETEAEGERTGPDGRGERLERLSSRAPLFELSAEGREAKLLFRGLEEVTVNYYEMDLEFLFSSRPFVSGGGGQFGYIRPNFSETKALPADGDVLRFGLPEAFASKNVLVEVVAGGRSESVAIYANTLKVHLSERYGLVEVREEGGDRALPSAYVKVYGRMRDGTVRFLKDGYTDLRGKFDYLSLNTDEIESLEALSLLVMSEAHGSLVREAAPPQR